MVNYTGTIANINNKYVMLDVKRFIKHNDLFTKLLPNDIVSYEIDDNGMINILKILKREDQILFGIVKNLSKSGIAEIAFPNLPKFFTLQLNAEHDFDFDFQIHSSVIIKIGLNKTDVIGIFNSIKDRKNDKELFLTLYEEQAKLCSHIPNYRISDTDTDTGIYDLYYCTNECRDLTHLYTFNVDPTESKDFDDAISIDELENKIYVHIVDANAQIDMLSDNDINAFKHAFTLYLPEHVQNILPKDLAENKLSLIEGLERNVITVEFTINPETQDIVSHCIYKSIIKIKKRYDYHEFNTALHQYPSLYKFYEKWKMRSLNIPQLKLNVNNYDGKLINYILENNFDDAHKIVETLMVLTNLTISKHVGSFIPQRYHAKINSDNSLINSDNSLINSDNSLINSEITLKECTGNKVIDTILSIKEFRTALYDSKNKGHFGLGLETYTHFTSPIRRYFDVIIHRLLSGVIYENLNEVLTHINNQEKYIEKIIDCYQNVKMLTYFEENLNLIWKGYILSITTIGINVILEDNLFEIFIFQKDTKIFSLYQYVNVVIKSIDWTNLKIKAELLL
jgi:ribonuclease R